MRTATRNLLEGNTTITEDDDDDEDAPSLSISQKLINLTCSGYDDSSAYSTAMPIFAHVALYRKTTKNNRAYSKDGSLTPFACRHLNNRLVQDLLTTSEEAFVYLCIRKEVIRRMHDKSHTAFTKKLKEAFVDCDDCSFCGVADDLTIHAKDGFRTEEIKFFVETRKKLKEQRKKEKEADRCEKVSRFYYEVPSETTPTNSAKKRRDAPAENEIVLDSDDDFDLNNEDD